MNKFFFILLVSLIAQIPVYGQNRLLLNLQGGIQIFNWDYKPDSTFNNKNYNHLAFSPNASFQLSYFLSKKLYFKAGYQLHFLTISPLDNGNSADRPIFQSEIPLLLRGQVAVLKGVRGNIFLDFGAGVSAGFRLATLNDYLIKRKQTVVFSWKGLAGPEYEFNNGVRLGLSFGYGRSFPKHISSPYNELVKIRESHFAANLYYSQPFSTILSKNTVNKIVSNFRGSAYKILFFNDSEIYK